MFDRFYQRVYPTGKYLTKPSIVLVYNEFPSMGEGDKRVKHISPT